MSKKKETLIIDYKGAIAFYNESNPTLKPINQKILAEKLHRTTQTLISGQKGEVSHVLVDLKKVEEITGYPIEKIIKYVKK